jgi:Mor family transcriptional regulator
MKYVNAKDILPSELLDNVQKYAVGKLLYIPQYKNVRKDWGSQTEIKKVLYNRNKHIKCEKGTGKTIEELMAKYNLSYDTIKKIVYLKEA